MRETEIQHLLEQLNSDEPQVLQKAALKLGSLGEERAIPRLIELLDPHYRTVTQALKDIGDPAFAALLRELVEGTFAQRVSAADALGEFGDTRAIPNLVKTMCEDEMGDVGWSAAMSLVAIGNEAVPSLIEALWSDCDVDMAIEALRRIDESIFSEAIPRLITKLCDDDENNDVRDHANKALIRIGAQAVPYLIDALAHSCDFNHVLWILKRIGTPEARAAIDSWKRENKGQW